MSERQVHPQEPRCRRKFVDISQSLDPVMTFKNTFAAQESSSPVVTSPSAYFHGLKAAFFKTILDRKKLVVYLMAGFNTSGFNIQKEEWSCLKN